MHFFVLKHFTRPPDAVISFGDSLGDDLLCTIVAEQLKNKGYKRIWFKTCFPDLFVNNPVIKRVVIKNNGYHAASDPTIEKFLDRYGPKTIIPSYTQRDSALDQDRIPEKHIVKIMCDVANVDYPKEIKPFFYLSKKEITRGKLFENQICIQSSGKGARNYMANKDWIISYYDDVVSGLKQHYNIVQLGSKHDPKISGVIDLRGKTSIRETAAILHCSEFFIGTVGFLMHLSSSVNCKSIIIYGGRESPDQTGYKKNINLYAQTDCAPCWSWNRCANDKECMRIITPKDVLNAVEKLRSNAYKQN